MNHLSRKLSPYTFEVSLKLMGSRQGGLDMRKHIFRPHVLQKA